MHHLHIGTTRALSCVVSADETVDRPWYSNRDTQPELSIDDPRLARVPEQYRRQFLQQFLMQSRNPDIMVSNPAAITTRVSPSFLRIGHIDLFARRAKGLPADSLEQAQLAAIVEHACFREFPGVCDDASQPLAERAVKLLEASADAICTLTANWVRVGFVQGNFNSDNCLVGGRTMDYGPFGWVNCMPIPLFPAPIRLQCQLTPCVISSPADGAIRTAVEHVGRRRRSLWVS